MNYLAWRLLSLGAQLTRTMHCVSPQTVRVEDAFQDGDLILDLGGGGEGVIGRLRGRQVVAVDIRKDELDETPAGPIKVVGDARHLPFPDHSFEAVTAFFFLMYVPATDRSTVVREAFRVLMPGGSLRVWDVAIPAPGERAAKTFVVPVCAELPGTTIRTAYGVPWRGRQMSDRSIAELASDAGFAVSVRAARECAFYLVLTKPP
ncbi:MAG: class I SAM-dependent methyltransferase [Candidatus Bipolaricaulis sp.]|nr:class I SAM-dependent methyltransferase [Candidatus Bipolaricaulis sp.]